jgi:surface antigen
MTSMATRALIGALAICGAAFGASAPAQAQYWQCVTYARSITGIQIFGNANTWWSQAKGKYARGSTPRVGAVMAIKPYGKMRIGHVAMVSRIVSEREVLLTHANWSRGGKIERDVRAMDVSDAGDWSRVKVWYGPIGGLGLTSYPVHGFIYSDKNDADEIAPVRPTRYAENRLADVGKTIDGLRD